MNRDALRWRIALRAFPRRFRAERGSELLDTLEEADSLGATPGVSDLFDVVRAGWLERRRTRPPLQRVLAYRFFNKPIPQRWHPWLFDDVRGWFLFRSGLWGLGPVWIGVSIVALPLPVVRHLDIGTSMAAGLAAGSVVMLLTAQLINRITQGRRAEKLRRDILFRHGFVPISETTATSQPPG
jgi:hypothetical protein